MAIKSTGFRFPFPAEKYSGKVRDVYNVDDEVLIIVATDRISAFDVILPEPIPHKGQILNQTAAYFLQATADLVPNHLLSVPDPNVTIGLKCEAIPVEMVVRRYLTGHAWRVYKSGERMLCGVKLPEGLREHDPFPEPIITPATKSVIGHDEDISEYEILKSGLIDGHVWEQMKHYALSLFAKGTEMAKEKGLILVDTKYEFGLRNSKVYLIDEVHTPDSSRYFYLDGYEERQKKGEQQKQLSKEFVREWLMHRGFQGKEGQKLPAMDPEFVASVSLRYRELFEKVTGQTFVPADTAQMEERIFRNVVAAMEQVRK